MMLIFILLIINTVFLLASMIVGSAIGVILHTAIVVFLLLVKTPEEKN